MKTKPNQLQEGHKRLFTTGTATETQILRQPLLQSVPFKTQPTTITHYGSEMKSEAGPPPCNTFSQTS
jgi:hypothetical protein